MPFTQRTLGDLLEEMYTDIYEQIELLKRQENLNPDQLERLARLENLVREERHSLVGLTEEESLRVWETAHITGDPLTDKWEMEWAAGKTPDLEENYDGSRS